MNGWGRSTTDDFEKLYKKKIYYAYSIADAYLFAKELGVAVDIQYENYRYHTKKTISDNYKWKGLPKEIESDD